MTAKCYSFLPSRTMRQKDKANNRQTVKVATSGELPIKVTTGGELPGKITDIALLREVVTRLRRYPKLA